MLETFSLFEGTTYENAGLHSGVKSTQLSRVTQGHYAERVLAAEGGAKSQGEVAV